MLLNAAMCFERSNHLNANPYERIKGSVKGSVLGIVNYPPSFLRRYKRWFR